MKNFIKGIAIGIATLVPGVSGGTMSLILGVYDEIIHAVGSFFSNWKKNMYFLAQIGLGCLLAFALFSNLISYTLQKLPMQMGFLFAGVILGGIPVLYKKVNSNNVKWYDLIFLLIGFILVIFMSKDIAISTFSNNTGIINILVLLLAGIIVAIALILPGISGSFMLLALGLYEITIESIKNFYIPFLIPLFIGVFLGTVATTKTIESFLNKYPKQTYLLILGFVLGSVLTVFPGIPYGFNIITSLLSFLIGFVIIYSINKINF